MSTRLHEPDNATLEQMLDGYETGAASPSQRERVVESSMRAHGGAVFFYVEETGLRRKTRD